MSTTTTTGPGRTERAPRRARQFVGQVPEDRSDPAFLAFWLLRVGFTAAPILFGLDKFFDVMVEWDRYLWSGIIDLLPGNANQIMYGVGVVEIVAGLVVLFAPRIGGLLVAGWLGGIIVNLVAASVDGPVDYWDIAFRDFGLMVGALALFLLATKYGPLASPRHATARDGGGGSA